MAAPSALAAESPAISRAGSEILFASAAGVPSTGLVKQKTGKLGKVSVLKKLTSSMKAARPQSQESVPPPTAGSSTSALRRSPSDAAKKLHNRISAGILRGGSMEKLDHGALNLDAEVAAMSEKELQELRADLVQLDAEVSAELRRTLTDSYQPFILASQGIGKLEAEMQQLRGILASLAAMMGSLKCAAEVPPSQFTAEAHASAAALEAPLDWRDSMAGVAWANELNAVDLAMAERRGLDALNALKRAQLLVGTVPPPAERLTDEEAAEELESRRLKLMPFLEDLATEGCSSGAEVRLAVGLLAALAGRPHAVRLLLASHSGRLKRAQGLLFKPQNSGGGEADGTELAGAVAQHVFRTIGAAADDMHTVFGEDATHGAALFLVWALAETERSTLLLKRHVLTPFAVPAGLGATVRCVLLMHVHAAALQTSHGISMGPRITRDLWPPIQQVLQRRLRRLGDGMRKSVTAEVDKIVREGLKAQAGTSSWAQLMLNFPTANDFLDEVKYLVSTLLPLPLPQVAAALRKGFVELFGAYTGAVSLAFAKHKSDGRLPESLDAVVDEAMEAASLLIEQFLPEVVLPLRPMLGNTVLDIDALMAALETLGVELGLVMTELEAS